MFVCRNVAIDAKMELLEKASPAQLLSELARWCFRSNLGVITFTSPRNGCAYAFEFIAKNIGFCRSPATRFDNKLGPSMRCCWVRRFFKVWCLFTSARETASNSASVEVFQKLEDLSQRHGALIHSSHCSCHKFFHPYSSTQRSQRRRGNRREIS